MTTLLWLITIPLLAYLLYLVAFYFIQHRMLFPVHELPLSDPALIADAGGEIHRLEFSQGEFEVAYLPPLKNFKQPFPVLMVAHGNGNIIDDWAPRVDYMREHGYAVVLVEYPGYGRCDGSPSFDSISETMNLAYEWVEQQQQLDKRRIVLLGRSMGGGAVLTLVPRHNPIAIVLMSTYSSIVDLAYKRLLPAFLVQHPFDNVKALSEYKGMVYLIHGKADKTVPIDALNKLLTVKEDATHKVYETAHADTPGDWDEFWKELEEFLKPVVFKE